MGRRLYPPLSLSRAAMDPRSALLAALLAIVLFAFGFGGYYLAVAQPRTRAAELALEQTRLAAAVAPVPTRVVLPTATEPSPLSLTPAEAPLAAPVEARPRPEPPTPAHGPASPAQERLVDEYLGRQASNDVPWILDLYADEVRYYDRGWVGHDAIYADKDHYFSRWPSRTNRLDSPVRSVVGADGVTTLRFAYRFTVAGDTRRKAGRAWVELDLQPTAGGYRIRGERGGVY